MLVKSQIMDDILEEYMAVPYKNEKPHPATKIIFLTIFFSLLGLLSFFTINPGEIQKRSYDESLLKKVNIISKAVFDYYKVHGAYPWTKFTGAKSPTDKLLWTKVSDFEIGLCEDASCLVKGEVAVLSATRSGEIDLNVGDEIYIGKGYESYSPAFVCFLPFSKAWRDSPSQLFRVDLKAEVPPPSQLESCPSRVSWEEADICYSCVSSDL